MLTLSAVKAILSALLAVTTRYRQVPIETHVEGPNVSARMRRNAEKTTARGSASDNRAIWGLLIAFFCALGFASCDANSYFRKTDFNALYCVESCQAMNECGFLQTSQAECIDRCYAYFGDATHHGLGGLRGCLLTAGCDLSACRTCDPDGIILGGEATSDATLDLESGVPTSPPDIVDH